MSRHSLTPKDPSHSVTVGWDNPLQTFFAQVQPSDHIGRQYHTGEIKTLDEARAVYCEVRKIAREAAPS